MQLKPGQRLRSQVCTTEVIVVRPPADDVDLTCGGTPMVDVGADVDPAASPAPGLDTGSQLGKRYTTSEESPVELLVTKAGSGTLAIGGVPLTLKEAKPLPASD